MACALRPPQGGPSRWRLAPPWLFDPWTLLCAGFQASVWLVVVVVWRPDCRSSPFLAACVPRAPHRSAPAPHGPFPCRPPSGRGRAGCGQSLRGGRTTGSGWLRPSAGPSKAPGLRALVQEGPGAPCLGHPPGPLSGCPAGEGCCALADQRWPPAHRQRQSTPCRVWAPNLVSRPRLQGTLARACSSCMAWSITVMALF